MKIIIIILVFGALLQISSAQIVTETHHNKNILGGGFNFHTSNNPPINLGGIVSNFVNAYFFTKARFEMTKFSISPYFGREITPNISLGIKLNYIDTKTEQKNVYIGIPQMPQPQFIYSEITSNEFGIGIFSRYTFNPESKVNLFIEPYFTYNKLNAKEDVGNNRIIWEVNTNHIHTGIDTGASYDISSIISATLKANIVDYVNGNREILRLHGDNENTKFSHLLTATNLSNVYFGFEIRL